MAGTERTEDVVQGALSEAWNLFASDFVLWIVAGLVLTVGSIVSLGILAGPLTVGFVQLVEGRRRGEPVSVADVFGGFSKFGASVIAFLLIGLGVLIGSLFMVVPGLLFGLAMAFTFHAIAIDDEDAIGGMKRSFELIRAAPAVSTVFLVILLVLGGLGGSVVFGTLLTTPFMLILMNLAYSRLSALAGRD